MSLAINPANVTGVLLADGWHDVEPGSFAIDAYEYVEPDGFVALGGGTVAGVPSTGFAFALAAEDQFGITGPLTSILAVRETE